MNDLVPTKKYVTGRRPVPIREYVETRMQKLKELTMISKDKNLSASQRKKFRAQKYALQKRF
jgi:hypothetical protein